MILEHKEHICICKQDLEPYKEMSGYFDGSCELDEYGYTYTYYELMESITYEIKSAKKKNLATLLKPDSQRHTNTPDCKLIELFKDGTIDWLALQKLTYTNCNL